MDPIYEYMRGLGWQPTQGRYTVYDYRTDKTLPGVYRVQIWLVGIGSYEYKDWVDWYFNRILDTYQEATSELDRYYRQSPDLIEAGSKARILNVDSNGGWGIVPCSVY